MPAPAEISGSARVGWATTWDLFWQARFNVPLLCAGTILILLPTLILFVLFQRQIIAALLQGSVKG